MTKEKLNSKFCTAFIYYLLAGAILLATTNTFATTNKEKPTTLSANGSGAAISITACHEDICKAITPPETMLDAIHDGYSQISLEDLTLDGIPEIILTHNAEGSVNACSKVYRYDSKFETLHSMDNIRNQLCNYSINNDHLVSSYRSGAKWHEDIYKIKNNDLILAFSDSCIGCDYINRTIYLGSTETDTLLVTDNLDYRLRTPISTTVISQKATLYSEPNINRATKMYLINGDEVALTDATSDENYFWYKIRYATKEGRLINAWLQCEDVKFCEK
ncbi:hypothetical protein SAMN05216229_10128 [Geopseudomonas sagittaria]|uniref:SH3 domain-containing protein n=1 Tax=Geopseudomonas sagittaria TaxID=1135990 RepID=A0A1I5NIZ3_9GAMM|nr:hypothetical protein [Pseudomonas sagittaria]SFP21692.1 hypothetical protein SAMN05216229_10128 [Pseudomonas sagittaria]